MSISTLRHVAIAGVGALLLSVQTAFSFGPTEVYRATEAIDYVLGSTHAIGHFRAVAGQCLLTLMIAEVIDLDRAAPDRQRDCVSPCNPGKRWWWAAKKARRCCSPAAPKPRPFKSRAMIARAKAARPTGASALTS